MKKTYRLDKALLDLLLENKDNMNFSFKLSENDTRILLTYIEVLQQENKQLKENNMSMQEEMVRTWEKADLYKEVIEEVREFVGSEEMYNCSFEEETNKLLQILDKAKDSDE